MNSKIIDIPIYEGKLIIYKLDNWDEFNLKYDNNSTNRHCAVVITNYPSDEVSEYIVAFRGIITGRIIVHECKHLLNLIFRDKGIMLDVNNDEAECYFLDWLFSEVEDFVMK